MTDAPDNAWQDAAIEVTYWIDRLSAATTLGEPLARTRLTDASSDLRTFLPSWDYNTGTMPWDRGEDT